MVYTPSAEIMADGLTKALTHEKFEKFVRSLGLVMRDLGMDAKGKELDSQEESLEEPLEGLRCLFEETRPSSTSGSELTGNARILTRIAHEDGRLTSLVCDR